MKDIDGQEIRVGDVVTLCYQASPEYNNVITTVEKLNKPDTVVVKNNYKDPYYPSHNIKHISCLFYRKPTE